MGYKVFFFTADWCSPCRQVKPLIRELVNEYKIDYEEVDLEKDGEKAVKFGVKGIPCVVVERDGEVFDMIHGAFSKSFYRKIFERLI